MDKKKWMAITVTTVEAVHISIAEQCRLFCIDGPLYEELRDRLHTLPGADDYAITRYDDLGFAMFKRIRGERCFDNEHFEPYYPALLFQ